MQAIINFIYSLKPEQKVKTLFKSISGVTSWENKRLKNE